MRVSGRCDLTMHKQAGFEDAQGGRGALFSRCCFFWWVWGGNILFISELALQKVPFFVALFSLVSDRPYLTLLAWSSRMFVCLFWRRPCLSLLDSVSHLICISVYFSTGVQCVLCRKVYSGMSVFV